MKPLFFAALAAVIVSQTAKADYADLARAEQQAQQAKDQAAAKAAQDADRDSYNGGLYAMANRFAARHGGFTTEITPTMTPDYGGSEQIPGLIASLSFSTGDGNECQVIHGYYQDNGGRDHQPVQLNCINAKTGVHTNR